MQQNTVVSYRTLTALYRPIHFMVKWDEYVIWYWLELYRAARLRFKRFDERNNEAVVTAALWEEARVSTVTKALS
jgi:hypothetical protein